MAIVWGFGLAIWFLTSLPGRSTNPSSPLSTPAERARAHAPDTAEVRSRAYETMQSAAADALRAADRAGEWSDDLGYQYIFPRRDPWGEPLRFRSRGDNVEIRSSGPDGRLHSGDDLTWVATLRAGSAADDARND